MLTRGLRKLSTFWSFKKLSSVTIQPTEAAGKKP